MNLNPLAGMRIIQSTNAVERLQAKVYPKRKAKNASHLRRMNNKWRKRYGFTYKPTMYRMGDMFIVHPALMPRLRAAFPTPDAGGAQDTSK